MGILDDLRNYYDRVGIAAEHFACQHEKSCRSVCADMVTPREAFVGSLYEAGVLPRLLFVSLDSSNDHPGREPSKRTLAFMRYCEENGKPLPEGCQPERLHKGRHWYETHSLAHEMLNPIAISLLGQPIDFCHIHKYFAHTNSAKCKDAARNTAQGHDMMFDNCREFIAKEVELLQPDVIVTQGKWARIALDESFQAARDPLPHPQNSKYVCQFVGVRDKVVLKISTFHQNNRGEFKWEKKIAYSWYCEVAREFLAAGERHSVGSMEDD